MPTYLDDIVAFHRRRAAAAPRAGAGELARRVAEAPPVRPFAGELSGPGLSVIAEVKRRSPSKGDLAPDLDPASLAAAYEAGGATCLSVLTDEPHFGGSASDLVAARAATALPALRKDFTVCEADVYDARAMGADAVLLIVAALDGSELRRLLAAASSLSMAALVEVHDSAELSDALEAGASLVGVNQRDLRTFEVDRRRAEALAALIPDGVVKVAESGIGGRGEAARLEAAGYDAVLVGESLVRSTDAAAAVAALRGVPAAVEEAAPCS